MENYSYNSYPDSGDSSPRSREIDFENPAPWEDQNYKMKFMCSYGGKIHPRPHDNLLSYIGGETKILALDRNTKFTQMISKLSALCGDTDVSFKYQLPGEDLDALISVTNDDDLEHMMHEYDRLYRASAKPARMRLFLFPVACAASFGSEGSNKSDRDRFVEALNSFPTQSNEKQANAANNVDFLFGFDKVKLPEPVAPPPPPPPPEVVGSDHVVNPVEIQRQLQELQRLQIREQQDHVVNPVEIQRQLQELQRLQIREQQDLQQQHQQALYEQHEQQHHHQLQQQQQQQQAMYGRKNEENIVGAYATGPGDYYVQKIMEKAPLPAVTTTVQPAMPAHTGFWPEKQISGGGYPATMTTTPPPPEPMYMIPAPAPGAVFHHHAPVMRQVTGQTGQGGYYTNVQRMPTDVYREQQMYNVVPQQTQPPPISVAPPPQVFPPQPGMGVVRPGGGGDTGYTQVYYSPQGGVVVPPQYPGVGVPVSGEMRPGGGGGGGGGGGLVQEGKVVVPKVPQASV